MNAPRKSEVPASVVEFTLNGRTVEAFDGESILAAAKRAGVAIPHLCYKEGYRADGNCRACVVEVKGERVLAPSCCRAATSGMEVTTNSPRAEKSQRMVLELLLSDMPARQYRPDSELDLWAARMAVGAPRAPLAGAARMSPNADASHPAIAVNLDACIQCTRCVRACREEQANDVIGYAMRGDHSKIVFDLDDPMGESTCVACGECVQACPTGALMPAGGVGMIRPDRKVDSVCPYCGVGCLLTYNVKDNRILSVDGRDGPANHGRLCVKGRYGFDYVHHRQRLTRPLVRRADAPPKSGDFAIDPERLHEVFREASWEEALDLAAGRLKALKDRHGNYALAGFGSAKGSNEEAYLFQKLVRTGFGSNNVDHCTRLCHASSVAALLEGVGSGAVSNQVSDVRHADLVLVIGANPTSNHPVAATWIKNAARAGTRLVVADPRRNELHRNAWRYLQFKPDTDVALLNAMMYTIVEEGLVNEAFVRDRTSGYEALRENVRGFAPEAMEKLCGIPAATIREVARAFATAGSAMILWGMGVSQHIHGTDNARCLIALCMMTGQIGRPGTGLHPLRGQNNVQGASDAGLIPMMLPDYRRVDNPEAHAHFEKFWGMPLDTKPGYTVVEIMGKAKAPASDPHKIYGMYIMGENPAMSDPDLNHAREALASLEWLVVQDIFMTETAYLADVVLPASAFPEKTGTFSNTDRMVQLGRRALDPPGEARQDLWIIQQIARRIGLDWNYTGPESGVAQVFEEMRRAMPSIGGMTWARLEAESSLTYPLTAEGDPGTPVVFTDSFPTPTGRAKLVPADIIPAAERPDRDYPFVLITGRQLEHWHTGAMTRRASVLDAIEPFAFAMLHPLDLEALGVAPGEVITVASRRGEVALRARVEEGTPRGGVFIPFCYYEAAANLLTNPALDPFGKIPEFKYCAVRVTAGGRLAALTSYGGGTAKAAIG
ncbi:MAG: formate dehydrogenase subunit alpha [Burkholderiales bacterium]|nr:formate dehydrogenase subunit alpha [Burkholderiales bacterium]